MRPDRLCFGASALAAESKGIRRRSGTSVTQMDTMSSSSGWREPSVENASAASFTAAVISSGVMLGRDWGSGDADGGKSAKYDEEHLVMVKVTWLHNEAVMA